MDDTSDVRTHGLMGMRCRIAAALAVSLAIAGLAGCFPVKSSYYSLSSPVGVVGVVGGSCGSMGKETSLSFDRGDVKVYIPELLIGQGRTAIQIRFFVPTNAVAQIDWDGLRATDATEGATGKPVTGEVSVTAVQSGPRLTVTPLKWAAVFDGSLYQSKWGNEIDSEYEVTLKDIPVDRIKAFDLQFPAMVVHGTSYPGFTIHYRLTTGVWIQPANC